MRTSRRHKRPRPCRAAQARAFALFSDRKKPKTKRKNLELASRRLAVALRVTASRTITSHAVLRLPHAPALRALKFEILKFCFWVSCLEFHAP